MERLNINKGAKSIQIAELAKIQDKEKVVLGNYDNDLILRTKGSIVVQIQNKFYELPLLPTNSDTTSNSNNTVSNGSLITELSVLPIDLSPFNNGFIITPEGLHFINKGTSYLLTGEQTLITDFTSIQQLNANQIANVFTNLQLVTEHGASLQGLNTDLTFSKESGTFWRRLVDGTWVKLNSDLSSGGNILGDITMGDNTNQYLFKVYTEDDQSGILLTDGNDEAKIYMTPGALHISTNLKINIGGVTIHNGMIRVGTLSNDFDQFSLLQVEGQMRATSVRTQNLTTVNFETETMSIQELTAGNVQLQRLVGIEAELETATITELTSEIITVENLDLVEGTCESLNVKQLEVTENFKLGDDLLYNGLEIGSFKLGSKLEYTNGVLTVSPDVLHKMFQNLSTAQLSDIKTILGLP